MDILRNCLRILVIIFVGRWIRNTQIAIAVVVLGDLFEVPGDIEFLHLSKRAFWWLDDFHITVAIDLAT